LGILAFSGYLYSYLFPLGFYSMKAKSFSLMPLIQLSKRRFIMVSKKAIYNLIPQKYPITELIKEGQH
jgi:hypothetical protein